MSAHPTFVFIPGAWHHPSCYDIARDDLTARGYESEYVVLPTVGAQPPNKGLDDDAGAAAGELLGDGGANARVGARHDGNLVLQRLVWHLDVRVMWQGKQGNRYLFVLERPLSDLLFLPSWRLSSFFLLKV
ncbi:hypothetical protein G7054_g7571 [Neopestalotiopsis clavispora]|nr:hypothetical protein G7054_g7571 [Neopestalotiopsis clavispora]